MTERLIHQLGDLKITSTRANTGVKEFVLAGTLTHLGCVTTRRQAECVPGAMPWYLGQPSP